MKDYYVYISLCSDGSYYIGITNDIERRLSEHQSGLLEMCYTFRRRPLELVFLEVFQNPVDAISREKQLKSWTRGKKRALINKQWDTLHRLAKCFNLTSHVYFRK